jgi:miniconductance mechanosensitive channel
MYTLELKTLVSEFLNDKGLTEFWSGIFAIGILFILILVLGQLLFWIARKVISNFFIKIAKRTTSEFDDILIHNKVPNVLSYFPVLFLYNQALPTHFLAVPQEYFQILFETLRRPYLSS